MMERYRVQGDGVAHLDASVAAEIKIKFGRMADLGINNGACSKNS